MVRLVFVSCQVVLLDECSQMTEPSSLLPVARFGCEKLLLVGDPKVSEINKNKVMMGKMMNIGFLTAVSE